MTVGWKLRSDERAALLLSCPARYARVIANHVTLVPRSRGGDEAALPHAALACVIGRADDGIGVEALMVEIDGTAERPGGGIYHITWSLGEGRAARESNDVIATDGCTRVENQSEVIALELVPARW